MSMPDTDPLQDQEELLNLETPLVFADGSNFYKKLSEGYLVHQKGFFILGPSGVGKSHYYRQQKENAKHWIDADRVWRWSKAMPKGAWWEKGYKVIKDVESKCDIITAEAKKMGFWLIGSANNWLLPDAIVIPHWNTHVKLIKKRELNFDGGARSTPKDLAQLKKHRQEILLWAKKGVPKFNSVEEAVAYLEKQYQSEFNL
jgi:hypothetical protein